MKTFEKRFHTSFADSLNLNDSAVEQVALEWLNDLGYKFCPFCQLHQPTRRPNEWTTIRISLDRLLINLEELITWKS